MNQLDTLEAKSVHILREAYRSLGNVCMLWSIGKDSTVMLRLARKAFFGHVPFPLVHIDTDYKMPEMIEYRDRLALEWRLNLIVRPEPQGAGGEGHLSRRQRGPHPVLRTSRPWRSSTPCRANGRAGAWITPSDAWWTTRTTRRTPASSSACAPTKKAPAPRSATSRPRDARTTGTSTTSRRSSGTSSRPTSRPARTYAFTRCSTGPSCNIWEYIERENIPVIVLYFDHGDGTALPLAGLRAVHLVGRVGRQGHPEIIDELRTGKFRTSPSARPRPGRRRRRRARDAAPRGVHVSQNGSAGEIPPIDLERMDIVIVGHVDHGKSTVIGRLLADTGSLPEGKLEQVKDMCKVNARPFEYAFLLDALKNEQAQGITIDTARCFFKTRRRHYIINDAPGHIEFLKNMVTGAASAQAALLVIDAQEGVRENSKRHGYILQHARHPPDRRAGQQDGPGRLRPGRVRGDRHRVHRLPRPARRAPRRASSRSARERRQHRRASPRPLPWYSGPTVLGAGRGRSSGSTTTLDRPFRMPVQDIYKFTDATTTGASSSAPSRPGACGPGTTSSSCRRASTRPSRRSRRSRARGPTRPTPVKPRASRSTPRCTPSRVSHEPSRPARAAHGHPHPREHLLDEHRTAHPGAALRAPYGRRPRRRESSKRYSACSTSRSSSQ